MSVIAYSGYRGEEEPRAVVVDGERLEVTAIEDRWYDPEARYFRVRVADGDSYLLCFRLDELHWSVARASGAVVKGPW